MNEPNAASQKAIEKFVQGFLASEDTQSFNIERLAGDASSRRYHRVAAGEKSYVLMEWEPFVDDMKYPFLSVLQHFARHGVQVPSVVARAPELGLVLLEDLGDLTLERKFWENQDQRVSLPYYRLAIDELIKMHYPATLDRSHDCTAFHIEFDTEKLLWEMNYGRDHLLLKLGKVRLSESEDHILNDIFLKICERLHREEKFIAHRDYHSRNAMIKLGKLRVIDFQDARLGPVQYDLVSLLRDSYVNMSEDTASGLIDYYLDRRKNLNLGQSLPDLSKDRFLEIYELQTIQRCFKACGSFASFYNLREDTRYLQYLPRTLQTVKQSLGRFPEYRQFLSILDANGLFEEKFDDLI